jgi:hypothetical protein
VDVLCADYHAPSLLFAAWKIAANGLVSLPEAVKMVTLHPARAVGLDHRIGSLAVGKQADIAVVDASGPSPAVETTLRAGLPCFRTQAVDARRPAPDSQVAPARPNDGAMIPAWIVWYAPGSGLRTMLMGPFPTPRAGAPAERTRMAGRGGGHGEG